MAKKRDNRELTDYRPPDEMALVRLLDVKFPAPAWAFLPFVRSATGYGRTIRTADGVAMSLWPSRGLELLGFEIKVSRGDWLQELKNPEKADAIFGFCHRWYIVAGDDTIMDKAELPSTWGLMVKKGRGLRTVTEAPKLQPKAIDLSLLCAILRRVQETQAPKAVLKKERAEGYSEGVKSGEQSMQYKCDGYLKELKALRGTAETFERVCGVDLSRYDWSGWAHAQNINIAEAVRVVMTGQYMDHFKRLMALRDNFQEAVKAIDAAVEKAQKAEEVKA